MNMLAHAVLSFHEPDLLFGQLISDFVKGRKQFDFDPAIRHGITLHRQIDTFTDNHPVTAEAKKLFRPVYRLYSGAFTDVSFDYFLANKTDEFLPGNLFTFSQQVYAVLDRHTNLLPPTFARMFPYMKRDNWLAGYAGREGIFRSFGGLVHRSSFMTDSQPAAEIFDRHFDQLEAYFNAFWPELKKFANHEFAMIKS